jgi:branched-chain amino acid transport system permease protein
MAVGVGLAMGVATALVQGYLPPDGWISAAAISSIPFLFITLFLLYFLVRSGEVRDAAQVGGPLDAAIAVSSPARVEKGGGGRGTRWLDHRVIGSWVVVAVVAVLIATLSSFWAGLLILGVAVAVAFLSFTLVLGEGNMIWLCQITFAGVGALTTAQLATEFGWPVLPAMLVSGLVALPMGIVIGALTIRLGELYIALVTLAFGLLMERLVFSQNVFYQYGAGVAVDRPFDLDHRPFGFLVLGIFCVVSVLVATLRRSTMGLALVASRWSEPATKTLGLPIFGLKLVLGGLAAFIAALGGSLIAAETGAAIPDMFLTLAGLLWLAVLVTNGVRSNSAALLAGITLAVIPGLFSAYLPPSLGNLPGIMFGLGAILVARHPDGVIVTQVRGVERLLSRLRPPRQAPVVGEGPDAPTATSPLVSARRPR